MHRVEPEVYLVGESALDEVEVERFLREAYGPIGEDWHDKNIGDVDANNRPSDSDLLTELMGRICYRSFGVGEHNKNITKIREGNREYVENILKSKHGSVTEHGTTHWILRDVSRVFCFHPSTEVLTKRGWVPVERVLDGELLLTQDPKTGVARWSENRKLHRFSYRGDLMQIVSSQWRSPAVTPDHTMWCARYDLRRCRDLSCAEITDRFMEKIPAADVFGKRIVVDHEIRQLGDDQKMLFIGSRYYDAGDFFEWLGWIASDGCISEDRNFLQVVQSKPQNIPKISMLMDRLFGDLWKRYEGVQTVFRVSDHELKKWVVDRIGRTKDVRDLTSLLDFSPKLLNKFVDGFVLGDGSVNDDHVVAYCGYATLAKSLQAVLASCGRSSNVRVVSRVGQSHKLNDTEIKWNSDEYVVSFHKKAESLVSRDHWTKVPYDGFVYCPQTDDGLVFARCEGMAAWFGNTHELVRHRAGLSPSQESLRYVRMDDFGLWIPKDPEITPEIEAMCEAKFAADEFFCRNLAAKLGLDDPGRNFEYKKKWTSFIRRFTPQGMATTIGITINFRALRHVIEMRTAAGAEVEIRQVFDKIAMKATVHWPSLLQDFGRNEKGEWVPEHSKI